MIARGSHDSLGHQEDRAPGAVRLPRRNQLSEYAGYTEDALEEDARRRAQETEASEEAAAQAAAADHQGPCPDAEIAQVHRSGRQHDLSDTDADKLPGAGAGS